MSSSSHWENSHGAANDGAPRIGSNDLNPVSSNNSLQSPSPATTVHRESPRGRSVWKPGTSDYLDGLRALPEVRPIPWVSGKELPPEKSTASSRTQTRGAFLLSTRGVIRDPPCSHCATGAGRFAKCVSLEGWFHGACATCQMGTRGNLCSLRTETEQTPSKSQQPTPESSRQSLPSENMDKSLKRKRDPPTPALAPTPTPAPDTQRSYVSPYVATGGGGGRTLVSNTPTPNPATQEYPPPYINYIRRIEPQNGTQRPRIVSSPQESRHIQPAQPVLRTQNFEQINQQGIQSFRAVNENQGRGREPSTSLSPSTQLLEPLQSAQPAPRQDTPHNQSTLTPSEPRNTGHPATPLIDTLPRKKQKQIFGIIGGIESGIRSVRQQTENLEKQLDLLRAALGIDGEDPNDDAA